MPCRRRNYEYNMSKQTPTYTIKIVSLVLGKKSILSSNLSQSVAVQPPYSEVIDKDLCKIGSNLPDSEMICTLAVMYSCVHSSNTTLLVFSLEIKDFFYTAAVNKEYNSTQSGNTIPRVSLE